MSAFLILAAKIWPKLSNEELSVLLWSITTYPMGAQDEVLAALTLAYEKSGGDFVQAMLNRDEALTGHTMSRHG